MISGSGFFVFDSRDGQTHLKRRNAESDTFYIVVLRSDPSDPSANVFHRKEVSRVLGVFWAPRMTRIVKSGLLAQLRRTPDLTFRAVPHKRPDYLVAIRSDGNIHALYSWQHSWLRPSGRSCLMPLLVALSL